VLTIDLPGHGQNAAVAASLDETADLLADALPIWHREHAAIDRRLGAAGADRLRAALRRLSPKASSHRLGEEFA